MFFVQGYDGDPPLTQSSQLFMFLCKVSIYLMHSSETTLNISFFIHRAMSIPFFLLQIQTMTPETF